MPGEGRQASEQAVLQELDRVLASAVLARSPQLQGMLKYLVAETLAGRAAEIKAFNIAVDVFGRATSFDPSTDTIVRVQAGRLRAALASHYDGEGSSSGLRIELPKGSYVPAFASVAAELPEAEKGRSAEVTSDDTLPGASSEALSRLPIYSAVRRWVARLTPRTAGISLAVVIAAAFLIAYNRRPVTVETGSLAPPTDRPADGLVVVPLQSISTAPDDQHFARALTAELATALTRTGLVNLRTLTTDFATAGELPQSHRARWALSGVLHRSNDQLRANTYLVNTATGHVIWSQNYTAKVSSAPDSLADLIILDLRPQLYMAAKQALEGEVNPTPSELFMLATWFPGAEVNSLAWQLERVTLARKAIAADPRSGPAYSVLADKLTLLANLDPSFDTTATWSEAAGAAREASVLAPHNADVAFNLALYQLHAGRLEDAHSAVRRTLELAPKHTVARFWSSVLPYTCSAAPKDVIDDLIRFDAALSPSNPARWQTQAWLARLHLNNGSYREAIEAAKRSNEMLPNLGAAILLIAALGETGDVDAARRVFDDQKRYWNTFSFDHYNEKALPRMCAGSPILDALRKVHRAAASALESNRAAR